MLTYQRFEDLPVWQEAIRLAEGCEDFIVAAKHCITWSKSAQLDRGPRSVSNDIVDGGRQRGKWPGPQALAGSNAEGRD